MDALKRARVLPGVGIKLTETLNGTVVSLKPPRAAGGGVATKILPWDIVGLVGKGEPDDDGVYPNYEASVWPGTINGILPENLVENDGLKVFSFSSGVKHFVATATTDGINVTSVKIEIKDTPAVTQQATLVTLPTKFEAQFGLCVAGKSFRTIGDGNITSTGKEVMRESADKFEYGALNYKSWWVWEIKS
jgi:hypothetical protein